MFPFTPALTRSLNIPTQVRSYGDNKQSTSSSSDSDSDIDVYCSPDCRVSCQQGHFPLLFADVYDPFSPTRSLSRVLNLAEDPFLASRRFQAGSRRRWDFRDKDEALYLRIDMPGLSKEDLKISVDQNTLAIRGIGGKEESDEESNRKCSSRIDLPGNIYKLDEIKAKMKNRVLKLMVPKVTEDERKDVFQVQVE